MGTSSTKAKLVQSLMKLQSICVQTCNFFTSKLCPEPESFQRHGSSLHSSNPGMTMVSSNTDSGLSQVGGRGRGRPPPQFLTDQLTLSQPGGHILLTQYCQHTWIFRPCDGPADLNINPEA